jgi:hypothetical protein
MLAATILAERGAKKIYVGKAVRELVWPSGHKPPGAEDCDVIATFRNGCIVAEGKGATNVYKAIQQLDFMARLLERKHIPVISGLIVVPPNLPFAFFDGESWTHRDAVERQKFAERLKGLSKMEPPANKSYCYLLEEGFRSNEQVPACGFVPSADRYTLYTHAWRGRWSAPRPFVIGPSPAKVTVELALG